MKIPWAVSKRSVMQHFVMPKPMGTMCEKHEKPGISRQETARGYATRKTAATIKRQENLTFYVS